jgi:arylsulfatase A-like enzyme
MNLLLIHSDQHRYDCIGAHGLREVETPNLDRLCAEGTTFTRAYATIPICTPARASLLTGSWPTTHGSFCIPTAEIDRHARPELPTFFTELISAGYRTGWVGKYHQELAANPPGPEDGVDVFHPVWDYSRYREEKGLPPVERPHGLFGDENTVTPPEQSSLTWQADRVIELLESGSNQPFCVRWDPPEPHLPCNPVSEFASRYQADDIPPWSSFPDDLEKKPATQKRQKRIWGVEDWAWEQWQPVVRLYYGMITEMDHHIGRVLDTLDRLGLAENTLVIYSTDHGDYCGGHGQMDKHFNMYDDVTRVPLIARLPNIIPAGQTSPAFASNELDIARTLLEAAGVSPPESFVGENLIDMANGATPRDVITSQYFGTESGAYSMRMIRDDQYKFVYHPVGDCHELYDLEADPGELFNRIDDPSLAEDLTRLQSWLWDEMKAQGDRLANRWTAVELSSDHDSAWTSQAVVFHATTRVE